MRIRSFSGCSNSSTPVAGSAARRPRIRHGGGLWHGAIVLDARAVRKRHGPQPRGWRASSRYARMQRCDLRLRGAAGRPSFVDHVVGDREARGARWPAPRAMACACSRFDAVARDAGARDLQLLGAVDHQHAVDVRAAARSRPAAESPGSGTGRPRSPHARSSCGAGWPGAGAPRVGARRWRREDTISRSAGRSSVPVGGENAGARSARTSALERRLPGSTTSRAIWSVSMTGTPSAANSFADRGLAAGDAAGEADPKRAAVSPRHSCGATRTRRGTGRPTAGPHMQRDPAGGGEVGAERDRRRRGSRPRTDQRDARPPRRPPPASRMIGSSICQPSQAPSAAKQLEVAVAHAFLAGEQLEQLIDDPEAQVAGRGADDALARTSTGSARGVVRSASRLSEQAEPQQRQREAVGQQLVVEVDDGRARSGTR